MEITVCDKCGKKFFKDSIDKPVSIIEIGNPFDISLSAENMPRGMKLPKALIQREGRWESLGRLHLCLDCTQEFLKWIRVKGGTNEQGDL